MNKVIVRGIKEISRLAKQIAESSPNTVSTFLYYEPKVPDVILKRLSDEDWWTIPTRIRMSSRFLLNCLISKEVYGLNVPLVCAYKDDGTRNYTGLN